MKFLNFAVVLTMSGCHPQVPRDRATYLAEIAFTDRMLRESAPVVRDFVMARCNCASNVWRTTGVSVTDQQCLDYSEWWMVYTSRWAWHHGMMLYNARVTDTRPQTTPIIPPATCALPTAP
jgi:hypothetical protein